MSCRAVSVVVLTVRDMATAPNHICVYFDDGEPEHVCACGGRALYVLEEDGGVLVAIEADVLTVGWAPERVDARGELAISA